MRPRRAARVRCATSVHRAGRVAFVGGALLAALAPLGCGPRSGPVPRWDASQFAAAASQHEAPRVVELAAGDDHVCALASDGRVWCWGDNAAGQLGDREAAGMRPVAAPVPGLDDAVGLAAAASWTCALRAAGSVRCWGTSPAHDETLEATLHDAVEVVIGPHYGCVRDCSGAVACWEKPHPRLSYGPEDPVALAPIPELSGARALAAAESFARALLADGAVSCWEPGTQVVTPRRPPRPVGGLWQMVHLQRVRRTLVCAWDGDGTPYCLGPDDRGWLELVDTLPGYAGAAGLFESPEQLFDVCAWSHGGSAECSSDAPGFHDVRQVVGGFGHACSLARDGSVSCVGLDQRGELGQGAARARAVRVPGVSGARAITATADETCALTAGGVTCWGGNIPDAPAQGPFPLDPAVWSQALGSGGAASAGTPAIAAIGGGTSRFCALAGGAAHCWEPSYEDARRATNTTRVPDAGASAVAGGSFHLGCAVDESQHVRCWGDDWGRASGVVPGIEGAESVVAGECHACALTAGGQAWCWGCGGPRAFEPVLVATIPNARAVAVSGKRTCVADEASATCFDGGAALTGPERVSGLAGVRALAVGMKHACALESAGGVACWGDNGWGVLGDGTFARRSGPVRVVGVGDALGLAAGIEHTCALVRDGAVYCWGIDQLGELGIGAIPQRVVNKPVAVVGLPRP